MRLRVVPILLSVMVLCFAASICSASHYDPKQDTFTFFAWRSLGYLSNDMPVVKSRCFLGSDGTPSVGETGMADQGWHELHPLPGPQTATLADSRDVYPSIAGPVMVGNKPEDWAVFDLPIYWVYESDILASTQPALRMGQTFVATGTALDKISLHVASGTEDLEAVIRSGGPGGKQIGPASEFRVGPEGDGVSAGWNLARWLPGEVPLQPGKTYYVEISSKSGKRFSLRTHSTGNIYPGGIAYIDGEPDQATDLGLFIACERDDVLRSRVLDTDRNNWVRRARGVYFKAGSANIRLIFTQIEFPRTPFHLVLVYRVSRVEKDGSLTRVGSDKQCYNYAQPGSQHYTGVAYAADEIPLQVGQTYYLQIIPKGEGIPEDERLLPRCSLNVRIYGEKTAGMTPVIYGQRITETTSSSIGLAWFGTADVETRIHYGLDPQKLDRTIRVPTGSQQAVIGGVAPATTVSFRLVKTTRAGGRFETPVYQARTRAADGSVVTEPPLRRPPSHKFLEQCIGFLNLAVMDRMYQPPLPDVRVVREVALTNAGFEDSLVGWEHGSSKELKPVSSPTGRAAGWDLTFPEDARDSNTADTIYQAASVTPGRRYMLTASLYTDQAGPENWYARLQLGDLKARLVCDPKGGTEFTGRNSTQWFRTDKRWLRFAKIFRAESPKVNVGVSIHRYHDWPVMRVAIDDVTLVEIAE